MSDFFVAIGLVFAIEGLIFAAFPAKAKRAVTSVLETPDHVLRVVGITCATLGVVVIWLVRG
jgi:uncharacterized protein